MSDLQAETQSDLNADLEVPEEVRRATSGTSSSLGCVVVGITLAFPVLLYFGFFGLLVLDGLVLETFYFSPQNVSPQAIEAIQVIYAPLIFLVNWLMNP